MATLSDNLVLWIITIVIEWFFLARKVEAHSEGKQNLGWFLMMMSGLIGIWIFDSGGNYFAFIFGGIVFLISLVNFVQNLADD